MGGTTKQDRDFYISMGICPQCRKRTLEPNRRKCYECLGKDRDRYHKRKATGSLQRKMKRNDERKMTAYYVRKRAGICTKCGKTAAEHGLLCSRCYVKYRRKQIERKSDIERSERPAYGLCYICGKSELYMHYRVCKTCYEKRLETLPAMWEKRETSYFRAENNLVYARKMQKRS